MVSDKGHITIAYTGPAVDDGSMDVSVLGPALMALGTLVNEANRIANNDNSKIAVKVNADFQKGSFEIQLDVIRTISEQLQSLFKSHITVQDLLIILGLIVPVKDIVGLPSVIDVIKWVKKRTIDKAIKNDDGTVTLVIHDESMTVNTDVINIYQSVPVRESLDAMVSPVKRDGINSFEVRTGHGSEATAQTVKKDETSDFEFSVADLVPKEELSVQSSIQWVKILTVNFEDLKWRFQSGDNKYYAKIDDEEFLERIDEGLSFTKGDTLQIELEQTQIVKPDGNIKNEYRVTKVLKVQKRMQQVELPFESNDE